MKRELTNQELLDRYIHSVKLLLPPEKLDDIGAEIRSNLESLAEDRAAELGRELRPAEMSAILKQRGHPALVAIPYRDPNMRGLISPWFFPFYWFALRAMLAVWVTIRLIIAVFVFQGTTPAGEILWKLGRDILLASFLIPSGITWIFATWEYLYFKFRYWERWKPESLPPVPPPMRHPPKRPVAQIVGSAVWLVFFALALSLPSLSWVWGGRGIFSPSETVYAMRLPMWLLALFGVAQSWLNYTRFAKAEWRRFLFTAMNAAGLALAVFLLSHDDLLVAGPNWDPAQAQPLATLNQMLAGVLVLGCIFSALVCIKELRRYLRRLGIGRQTADSAS